MAQVLVERIQRKFPAACLSHHAQHGDETVVVAPREWHAVARFLRDEQRLEMLTDLTAVDYLGRTPRFEVVAHFCSLSRGYRLRLKSPIGDAAGEGAEIASLSDLWASANWLERECYDMFGIRFLGHPDLRRILLYPEFEGYPLRRDYPAERIQPLVPYREVANIDKLAPFGVHEGMSFGRQVHAAGYRALGPDGSDEELFPAARPESGSKNGSHTGSGG